MVKLNNNSSMIPATIEHLSTGKTKVTFNGRIKRVIPGRYIAFYKDNECIGSGIISEVKK